MRSVFDKELERMEREVRDLKTAHESGLGVARFYKYESTTNIPSGYYIWYLTAVAEDATLMPAVVLPFLGGNIVQNFSIYFTANGFVISTLAVEGTVTAKIVTSLALSDVQTRIEAWA